MSDTFTEVKEIIVDLLGVDESKITLDECPNKHGFWFNKGELESVVEMGILDKQNKIVQLLKEMFAYNLEK